MLPYGTYRIFLFPSIDQWIELSLEVSTLSRIVAQINRTLISRYGFFKLT